MIPQKGKGTTSWDRCPEAKNTLALELEEKCTMQ